MKSNNFEISLLVVRVKGVPIDVIPIYDGYTNVQVYVPLDKIDNNDIVELRKCSLQSMSYEENFYLGEGEAKDFCGTYGNVNIDIEKKEIEVI